MVGIVWMSTSHVQRLTLVGRAKSTIVRYKSTFVWYISRRPTTDRGHCRHSLDYHSGKLGESLSDESEVEQEEEGEDSDGEN